jgi:hypothetical protein
MGLDNLHRPGLGVVPVISGDHVDDALPVRRGLLTRNAVQHLPGDDHGMKHGVSVDAQHDEELVRPGSGDRDDLGHGVRDQAVQLADQRVVL